MQAKFIRDLECKYSMQPEISGLTVKTALQSTIGAGGQPPVQVQGGRGRCQRHPGGRRGEGGLQDHRGGGQQGHLDQGHPGQVEPGAGPADEGAQVAEAGKGHLIPSR